MDQSLIILGRQPALGIAELESLYGGKLITPVNDQAVLLQMAPDKIDFTRLGGSVKLTQVLTRLDTTNWKEIEQFLIDTTPEHAALLSGDGKLSIGLSVYNLAVGLKPLLATGLKVKKAIRATGRSVRIVPNKSPALNSAQVLHNNLTGPMGWELVFVRTRNQTIIARTTAEQDIEAYAARDQKRPKRDAKVGMLPPKLAQIIINLAVGSTGPKRGATVLDPFCGTGVVLQEASLMGYDIMGSDLDQRMVDYTDENLQWLLTLDKSRAIPHSPDKRYYQLQTGDATELQWSPLPDFIACETYLGRPFSSEPDPETLTEVIHDVNLIHKKFLRNVAKQTKPGFRLCIAVPAWRTKNGFKHLKTLDNLAELGYTRLSFVHVSDEDLIYHRPGQTVARELVVLIRK